VDRHEHQLYINDVARRAEEKHAAKLAAGTEQRSPAETLTAAATRLRAAATAAIHDGRTTWRQAATKGSSSPVVVDDPERPTVLIETYAERLEDVNAYLALVGPATRLALADWLDATADEMSNADGTEYAYSEFASWTAALATARALLGEVAE